MTRTAADTSVLVAALFRTLERGIGPTWLRLALVLVLGIGLCATAFLASLRGRGPSEQPAFYAFLVLSLDALGQHLAPLGWPEWPLLVLLLGAVAVAEGLALASGIAAQLMVTSGPPLRRLRS